MVVIERYEYDGMEHDAGAGASQADSYEQFSRDGMLTPLMMML